jgi:hypothetical protein
MIEHAGGKAQEGEEGSHLIVVATQAAHLWQEVKTPSTTQIRR